MAVDLLLNLEAARRLAPFMRCEQTLGSAANELEMPASSLAYWVARFQKAGLVTVVRHEPRAGKPIPVYRATADEFQVPLDAMPPGRRDEFLNGSRRHMFDEFTKAVDAVAERYLRRGISVRPHTDRGVEIEFLDAEEALPVSVAESWGAVALTDDEARELQETLQALSQRYSANRDDKGTKRYVMVLGLAPKPRR
jgi:hypothetical protein